MVRIRTNDIFITDDDKIIFGDHFDSEIFWDSSVVHPTTSGDLRLTTTISGVDPTEDYHLTTKWYVDDQIATLSGGIDQEIEDALETAQGGFIFGGYFFYASDFAQSSTNSTSYIEKLKLTVSGVPDGSYRVGFSWEWRHSKLNTEFEGQVTIDDDPPIFETATKPIVDVNTWRLVSDFYYIEALASGTHTIDIDYASANAGSTSYIRNTRIEFWRVS